MCRVDHIYFYGQGFIPPIKADVCSDFSLGKQTG